jgi:hypothetical protein
VQLGVDGETLAMDPPLLFRSEPGALRVRLPPHAIGVSPAARAVRILARSTAGDLACVCAGRPASAPREHRVQAARPSPPGDAARTAERPQ